MMNSTKSLIAGSALALALATPLSHAGIGDVYQDTFQGLTFTITEFDSDTLTFQISGTPTGDWSSATYLGAFDFKDLGIDFSTESGTAYGPGAPATGISSVNTQISGASNSQVNGTICDSKGTPDGSACFNLSPDYMFTKPIDLAYTIDFTAALNIGSIGPHLQIIFDTTSADGDKVGSLYSKNIAKVPEPSSSSLTLLGLAFLGIALATRRRRLAATA